MRTSFCTSLVVLAFVCLVQADAEVEKSTPSNGLTTLKDSIIGAVRSVSVLNAFKPAVTSTEVTTKASVASDASTQSSQETVSTEAVSSTNKEEEEKTKVNDASKSRRKRDVDEQGIKKRGSFKRLFSGVRRSLKRHQ